MNIKGITEALGINQGDAAEAHLKREGLIAREGGELVFTEQGRKIKDAETRRVETHKLTSAMERLRERVNKKTGQSFDWEPGPGAGEFLEDAFIVFNELEMRMKEERDEQNR